MSDVEILLRELNEKVDKLEHKVDNLTSKVKTTINMNYGAGVWGDDSLPPHIQNIEIKDPVPNPFEITCDAQGK